MSLNTSIVTSGSDALASEYNNLRKDVIEKSWDRAVTTWSSNAYVLSTDAQITSYVAWQRYVFQANFSNTWSCTLNVNTIWAKTIKDFKWNTLWSWAVTSWNEVEVIYDWTDLIVLSGVSATTSNEWSSEMATDAEALAWIDETKYVNSKQALIVTDTIIISRDNTTATWTVQYSHSLWKIPKLITFHAIYSTNQWSHWSYDWANSNVIWATWTPWASSNTSYSIRASASWSAYQTWVVSDITDTTFDIDWTKVGSPTWFVAVQATLIA